MSYILFAGEMIKAPPWNRKQFPTNQKTRGSQTRGPLDCHFFFFSSFKWVYNTSNYMYFYQNINIIPKDHFDWQVNAVFS